VLRPAGRDPNGAGTPARSGRSLATVEDQIYLVPGESAPEPAHPVSPRRRVLLLAAGVAVAAVAVAVQHGRARHVPAPVLRPPALAGRSVPAWPRTADVCGSTVEAPRLSSDPVSERTRASVVLAGPAPALVDVDTGRRSPVPGLTLRADQYASAVVRAGPVSYALVRGCQHRAVGAVVRARAGTPQRVLAPGRPVFGLLDAGAGGVWAEAYSGPIRINPEAALGTTLIRLDRPAPAVALPVSYTVLGIAAGQAVVSVTGGADDAVRTALYRYDLATHRASPLGLAYSATESGGLVLWTATPCSASGPCLLRSYDLATGAQRARRYYLPLGTGVGGGVLSPDRHRLAFALQRETPDPGYRSTASANPADLVVLDLTSGVLEPVPGIELAPGQQPRGLAFTADSRWLLAQPGGGAVLAWRSGQRLPMLSPPPAGPQLLAGGNRALPRR